jgi:hypothetical protein
MGGAVHQQRSGGRRRNPSRKPGVPSAAEIAVAQASRITVTTREGDDGSSGGLPLHPPMRGHWLPALFATTSTLCSCGSGGGPSDSVPDAIAGQDESDSGVGNSSGASDGGGLGGSSGSASSGSGSGASSPGDGGSGSDSGESSSGSSGSSATDSGTAAGPCDIYQTANTPCVAAHSTVRALYASYSRALYQVRRASDKTTKDIPVLAPGGFADTSVQDSFCTATTCTISLIYDQSPQGNDLKKAPPGATWLPDGGNESSATAGKTTVGGHTVYGIYVTGNSGDIAYRNNSTKGVATGDQPEAMYMVLDGKRYSSACCFDYGNAETSSKDDGNGTMEAIYWGTDTTWGGQGAGSGPWVAADLENGMFKGDKGGWQSQAIVTPSNKSVLASYATTMLKGPSGNHFTLKAGDAQSGTLQIEWDGARPSPGYSPKKLEGAIILGTGGDGSNGGTGTFFEGAMTSGNPPDATDDAVQANILAAGYGH